MAGVELKEAVRRPGEEAVRRLPLRWATAFVALLTVLGIWAAIQAFIRMPGAPPDVDELFPPRLWHVRIGVFSLLLVWLGVGPAGVGDYLVRCPRRLPLMPFWALLIGLVSWVLLHFSITRASLEGLLGKPNLGWGGNWELLARFLALQGIGTLSLLLAFVAVGSVLHRGWPNGPRSAGLALAYGGTWLFLCWCVVVGWSNTDTWTQLIRATPSVFVGSVVLATLALLVASNASLLAYAWSRGSLIGKLATLIISPILTLPGWLLLSLGLAPMEKHGMPLSATAFILGADPQTELSWLDSAVRWGSVQLAGVAVLALGGGIALSLSQTRCGTPPEGRDHAKSPYAEHGPWKAGRVYLILTLAYIALLFYGSLIPLTFQRVPLGDAWQAFLTAMRPAYDVTGQADMVTNIAMLVPLTFCALGALSREDLRPGRWWMIPAIFAGGVGVSFALEFSQVFVPRRTPSVHDVIAQVIGNVLGLAAWLGFGASFSRWVRKLVDSTDLATLHMRLLYTYTALFVFYSVLPLNPTVSLGQLWGKYKAGMIHVVPFSDLSDIGLLGIVMKTLLCVPVGYLLACQGGRQGRALTRAAVGGGLFALGVEILQVFIHGRFATTSDIVFGAMGATLGGLLAWLTGPIASGHGVHGAWWQRWGTAIKLPVAAGWFALIASHRWGGMPADFAGATMTDSFGTVLQMPPGSMVYSISPLTAAGRLAQECGAFLVMGTLIQALLAGYGRHRVVAFGVTFVSLLALELGCLTFAPGRSDATLAMFALAGAIASVWAYPRFVALFCTPAKLGGKFGGFMAEGGK